MLTAGPEATNREAVNEAMYSDDLLVRCTDAVSTAFSWVLEHLEAFDPLCRATACSPKETKALVELGIMLLGYSSATGDRLSPGLARAVDFVREICHRPDFIDWCIRSPESFAHFVDFAAVLRFFEVEHAELRVRLERAISCGAAAYHVERVPFQLMNLRLSLELADLTNTLPSIDTIYKSSILTNELSAAYISQSSAYAITHIIMFSTKYGADRPSVPPQLQSKRIHRLLSDMIVCLCQERHWDLLGEFLFAWECLELPASSLTARAWRVFLDAQRDDGSFPSSAPNSLDAAANLDVGEQKATGFKESYHTTLVGILAASSVLRGRFQGAE